MIIKGEDFVIIGLQPWYMDTGSNCKNLTLEIAKNNRVLYVNSPINRQTILFKNKFPELAYHYEVLKGKKEGLVKISENLWNLYPCNILESINWIPFRPLFNWLNKINNKKFAKNIFQATKKLGFKQYIIFNDNDIFRGFYLKEILDPLLYIYYCRDLLKGVAYFRKHASWLEPLHIAKADIAMANSSYLTSYLQKYNSKSICIGQGCDISTFNANLSFEVPQAIRLIRHPIIGYVGNLTILRLNINLLIYLAEMKPEWSIVLVGPEDEGFQKSKLHKLSNVYFTGKKELEMMPAFIQNFDVCINPQLIDEVTIGNYPLKIDEYLAMGKPVVATSTQAMELFDSYCYLASGKEDFLKFIVTALHENDPQIRSRRIAFAHSHSWKNSVEAAYEGILKTEKFKNKKEEKLPPTP